MMMFKNRPISIMVLFAVALHLSWATILMLDDAALNATAIHALHRYIASLPLLAATLAAAALLAVIGLFTRVPWVVLLLIPQQAILMMSAAGAVEAMWLGQFADGVLRPHAFIIADQFYSVLAAIGHTVAIVAHARRVAR
jgi:hypothetical protein